MLIDPGTHLAYEALAAKEWDAMQACLRIAAREEEALCPQGWLINDAMTSARRHGENWLAYRQFAALCKRRERA